MNREAIEYYKSISSRMENFCNPLNDYFSLPLFIYFKIYSDASYVLLSYDIGATEEYCSYSRYDSIYLQRYLENQQKLILWPESPCTFGTSLVFNRGYGNGLIIITEETNNSIECCCFISNIDNFQINEFFIKHNDVLKKFTDHFKLNNIDLTIRGDQCRAKYKDGYDFYLSHDNFVDVQSFLSNTGIEGMAININGTFIHLTTIEKKCLELLSKNLKLKEISKKLSLTPRTIEMHINSIRNKTGYFYRSDLIEIYYNAFVESKS